MIPCLSSPPLPRPVLESKDVFLKSSLLPQLLLGILLPRLVRFLFGSALFVVMRISASERMRAIKKHIKDHHPDETLRSLDNKRRIGSKAPPTFRESISRHLLQVRQKQYPTHHLIMVVTPRPDWDRRNFWRRDCFSVFKATTGTAKFDQPCKMRQQEMATNGWVLARKRYCMVEQPSQKQP